MISKLIRRLSPAPAPISGPPYPVVEIESWAPLDGRRNFGDHLSIVIASAVAARKGLTFEDEVSRHRRMLAIGSILHYARDGDTVWGSGVNGKIPLEEIVARRLDIRAVRGPKTAEVLRGMGHQVPDVFGDPGLLLPTLFGDRFRPQPSRDVIFVPNLHDWKLVASDPRAVSPLGGWNRVVEEILTARFVAASSLHGLIVAEAYGIPARYVRLSEIEGRFKYDDYAQGTGRKTLEPAESIEEAVAMGGHPPIKFDPEALLAAFPYDLWS